MAHHTFTLKGKWNGGRLGEGHIETGAISSVVTVPTQMGGPGVGTNPDDLLLGSAATCYMITLGAVLDNRKLPVVEVTLNSELVINAEGGSPLVHSITHRPTIVLADDATPEQLETADKAAHRAEAACMISKALRGNVELHVEPIIIKQ